MNFRIFLRACLFLGALATGALGQDLPSQLTAAAAAHKASSTQLVTQKAQAVEATRKPYLAALEAADTAATAAGNVAAVKALAKEREKAMEGGLGESFPADLPKTLVAARKAFLRGHERATADYGLKQKALDAGYLKTLAGLQSRAAGNPLLADQVTAEKQRVLSGNYGPLSDLRTGLEGTHWKDVGGTAKHFFRNGKFDGTWTYETPAANKVKINWNNSSSIVLVLDKDGKTLMDGAKRAYELVTEK